jgi:hypothetical protein
MASHVISETLAAYFLTDGVETGKLENRSDKIISAC